MLGRGLQSESRDVVVGGQRSAVAPHQTFSQLEAPGHAVVGHRPALGRGRQRIEFLVEVDQRVPKQVRQAAECLVDAGGEVEGRLIPGVVAGDSINLLAVRSSVIWQPQAVDGCVLLSPLLRRRHQRRRDQERSCGGADKARPSDRSLNATRAYHEDSLSMVIILSPPPRVPLLAQAQCSACHSHMQTAVPPCRR